MKGCKLVTCAWLMRTGGQMTQWWYDKLEGKLGKRAKFSDEKYELLASFLLACENLSAFWKTKKTQDAPFIERASNFRWHPRFRCDFWKSCILGLSSGARRSYSVSFPISHFTCFTSRRSKITMQASDAEVVTACKFTDYFSCWSCVCWREF